MTDWVARDSTHLGTDRIFTSPTATALYENLVAALEGKRPPSMVAPYMAPRILLDEKTASASASLDFTTGITSTYDVYELEIINLLPADNTVNLSLRMSVDGGSNYLAGASDYAHAAVGRTDTGVDNALSDSANTFIRLNGSAAIANTEFGLCGNVVLFNLPTTQIKIAEFATTNYNTTPSIASTNGHGWAIGATLQGNAVNALRILVVGGNLASGVARLYGRLK